MWLISLVLNTTLTPFATLMLQWTRRCSQLPQVPRMLRPDAQPFIFAPWHPFSILVSRRPSDILFHYPQDSQHRCPDCLDCSQT
ncbi:hypothetical protein F5888DRAFT_1723790, partial [Russula emetica]